MKKTAVWALILLLSLLPLGAFAEPAQGFCTGMNDFGEGEGYTWIKFEGDDGKTYQGLVDLHGSVSVYFEPVRFLGKVADGYTYISDDSGERYQALIDGKRGKIIASTAAGDFDQYLALGSYEGHGYFLTYKNTSGFYATGHTYSILDETGKTVYEKTLDAKVQAAYCGEGWFLFYDGSSANYYNVISKRTLNYKNASFHPSSVENGYTVSIIDGKAAILNLNEAKYTTYDMLVDKGHSFSIGPFKEGKAVVVEYNPYKTYRVKIDAMYYLSPGKSRVRLSTLEDNVYTASGIYTGFQSLQFANGKLLLPVMGADGKDYVAVVDENDRVVVQPIRADYLKQRYISDERIVLERDGMTYVYDDDGNYLFCAIDYGEDYISPFHSGAARLGDIGMLDTNGEMLFYSVVDLSKAVKLQFPW